MLDRSRLKICDQGSGESPGRVNARPGLTILCGVHAYRPFSLARALAGAPTIA